MKKEFLKLVGLYGISKEEGEQLERTYETIESLKQAISNNTVSFLKDADIERLKKYFNIKDKPIIVKDKLCVSCRNKLPKILDRNICPFCGIINL